MSGRLPALTRLDSNLPFDGAHLNLFDYLNHECSDKFIKETVRAWSAENEVGSLDMMEEDVNIRWWLAACECENLTPVANRLLQEIDKCRPAVNLGRKKSKGDTSNAPTATKKQSTEDTCAFAEKEIRRKLDNLEMKLKHRPYIKSGSNVSHIQSDYIQFLKDEWENKWVSMYSPKRNEGRQLSQSLDSLLQTEHVVPTSWMFWCYQIKRFSDIDRDLSNIVVALAEHNRQKSDKSLYFSPDTEDHSDPFLDPFGWAPPDLSIEKRRYLARTVAYMALTYPLICTNRDQLAISPCGMPYYALQYQSIIHWAGQEEVSVMESEIENKIFDLTGWSNPLTREGKFGDLMRKNLRERPNSGIGKLLKQRLRGDDIGSRILSHVIRRQNK